MPSLLHDCQAAQVANRNLKLVIKIQEVSEALHRLWSSPLDLAIVILQ